MPQQPESRVKTMTATERTTPLLESALPQNESFLPKNPDCLVECLVGCLAKTISTIGHLSYPVQWIEAGQISFACPFHVSLPDC